jgi:hypothetical protein
MLELYDPLWDKLGEHVPRMLSGLVASWDDEAAKSLLCDDLCHQETCYGATYAAIPHLLKIAEPEENRRQRQKIAFFLGFVALCARDRQQQGLGELQGLPETLEAWHRTGEPVNAVSGGCVRPKPNLLHCSFGRPHMLVDAAARHDRVGQLLKRL